MEHNGYILEHLGTFAMVKIKNKGQGPAPKPLQGYFTSMDSAMKAVDGYLSSSKKGTSNGTSKGVSKG